MVPNSANGRARLLNIKHQGSGTVYLSVYRCAVNVVRALIPARARRGSKIEHLARRLDA